MIYLDLEGRLGNVLFEIAAGASLAKRMNVPFKALTGGSEDMKKYLEPFRKTILRKIVFSENFPSNVDVYKEISFSYNPLPEQENMILKGYFQSEKYFDKAFVRDLFQINPETKNYILQKYGHILQLKPVAIHVRRGDYLRLEFKYPVCRMSYFKKAISRFDPNACFLVVSDDIAWCKKHFKGSRFYFAENNSPLVDLYLQSMCAHNIMSNSSFSWWGAWLNPNPDKKVVYPNPWFGKIAKWIEKQDLVTKDLCPESWIPISFGKMSYCLYGTYTYFRYIFGMLKIRMKL